MKSFRFLFYVFFFFYWIPSTSESANLKRDKVFIFVTSHSSLWWWLQRVQRGYTECRWTRLCLSGPWLQAAWIQISLVTGITCPRSTGLVENEQSWQQIESLISPSNGWFAPSGHVSFEEYEILEINVSLWNFIRPQCPQFIVFYVLMDCLKKMIT